MVDLVVFGGAAAARNGLTSMPVNSGEDFYKINSTNNLVMPADMYVLAALAQTVDVSKTTQWRFHRTDDADWIDFGSANQRQQTAAYTPDLPARLGYYVESGKQLAAELNNTNTSQIDNIALWISRKPDEMLQFGSRGLFPSLRGYSWHRFTSTDTTVAGIFSDMNLTATTFNPDDNAEYHIAGAMGNSATGYLGRLKHKSGGTPNIRPGFLVGDTALPDVVMPTYQDFGKFTGDQYPIVQLIDGAAVSAAEFHLLIKKL